jgi:SGNH hydrolase-like domain, acetyltransferase AlgX
MAMSRAFFLIGFVLILWLPMVQMVTGFIPLPALEENRKLAPAPVFTSWDGVDDYTHGAVNWFNDHFGFREFLIRLKTQIDYSVFGMSTRIHIGDDGWLFYRSVVDVQQPYIERTLRTDADAVAEGTRRLANVLAGRGVQLVVMVGPMKNVFYSNHLPAAAPRLPESRQIDLLQDRFRSMKEVVFLDANAILRETMKTRHVFHRTDFHWNDPAAFEVTKSLVNQLAKLEGRTEPVWAHELQIEERVESGGEATFMPIFFPPSETGLFVKQNWTQPAYDYTDKHAPFEWVYAMKDPDARPLPPMTVLGDSFFDGMLRSGIWPQFSKIYRARWSATILQELVDDLPPDTRFFFVEFIETSGHAFTSLATFNPR